MCPGEKNMKISARNHLKGVVKDVKTGAVNSVISLELAGGTILTAVITNESCQRLGLAEGKKAEALIKASQVLIGVGDVRLSAKNIFKGTVSSLISGPVNCELTVRLPAGDEIVSIITDQSRMNLELANGKEVVCIFKASSVILSVE